MKKFFKIFALTAIAASVFASCAKQFVSADESSVPMVHKTFTVSYSDVAVDGSKVTIGEGNALLWAEGDQLKVWSKTGSGEVPIQGYVTLVAGAGTATGTFSGEVPVNENNEGYYFLYNSLSSTKVKYSDPSINPQISITQKAHPGQCDYDYLFLLGISESDDAPVTLKTMNGFFKVSIGESTTHKIASVNIQTSLTNGKTSTVGGVTLSGAQRVYFNSDYTVKKYANSGSNYLTLQYKNGYDYLTPGDYWVSAAVTGLGIDNLFIFLTDLDGNYACLKGGACQVKPGKAISLAAISPDSVTWHTSGESIVVNAALTSATLTDDGIAVTGTLESYPDASFVNDKTWTVQYKADGDDSWSDSSLTGTGATVSGTVTGLPAGKTYFVRIACGNLHSNPSEGIQIPAAGNRVISFDVSDGSFFTQFTLKSGNGIAAASSLTSMTEGTSVYTYDGVDWTFSGFWGFASKKLCAGDAGTLGLPVISGMRLSKVTVDNADSSKARSYSVVDGAGNTISGGAAVSVATLSPVTFTLSGNTDATVCKLTVPKNGRIQKMTLEYEAYSGTKSGLHEGFKL